jgi:hypothetical protein
VKDHLDWADAIFATLDLAVVIGPTLRRVGPHGEDDAARRKRDYLRPFWQHFYCDGSGRGVEDVYYGCAGEPDECDGAGSD